MKKVLFYLIVFLIPIIFFSCGIVQNHNNSDKVKIVDPVLVQPEFPGGLDSLKSYLLRNILYPKKTKDSCIQGKVLATFIIERDGALSNVKILKSLNQECDEEVIRVIKLMPKWKPGCWLDSKAPVRVCFKLPVAFVLTDIDSLSHSDSIVYTVVDMQASFVGGKDSLDVFLAQNIKYINECDVRGKIVASFIVEKDGSISNIKLIRDIGCGLGDEYLRVLRIMPKWKPAEKNGKIVRQEIIYPMVIKLL